MHLAARALRNRCPSPKPRSGARRTFGPVAALATVAAALAPGAMGRAVPVTPPDSLRLELVAPTTIRAGAPVPVALRLTNVADRPAELHLVGREIAFDIVVAREDGTVVWRRLTRAAIQGILQIRTLAPGETLELRDVWRQRSDAGHPVPPGTYTLLGVVPTEEPKRPLRTAVAQLRILPR